MKNMNSLLSLSLSLATLSGYAGDLLVEGDLNVTSNLTSRSLSVTNATVLNGPLTVFGKRVLIGANAATSNDNTFVWSDGTAISGTSSNQFTAFASNGFRLLGGPIQGNGSGLTGLIVSNYVAGSIGSSALASNSVTAAKLSAGSVGTAALATNSVTAATIAAGSIGTNKVAIAEWNAWGNGRYLSLTGSSDLVLNPGRIVAGYGLNLTNISPTAYGASQMSYNDGSTQTIGEWSIGASQNGYNGGLQTIGESAYGASQEGFNLGEQTIEYYAGGASQQGENQGIQTIRSYAIGASQHGGNYYIQIIGTNAYGASQRGYNNGTQSIGEWAVSASQMSYNDSVQSIGEWSIGALQCGYNSGSQIIGNSAIGAVQIGYNNGTQAIGGEAHGAEQLGYLEYSSFATNNGIGSIQLLNLTNSQTALITGSASIGLGACRVTNNQAIVAGDGLTSRGDGTVTAVRFFGDGSGLTNLTMSGSIPTNSVTTDKLAGSSVTTAKLADGSVTSAKIIDGSVVDADIATNALISQSKIAGLTAAVASLNTHQAAVNNPHGVTAAQLGALTNETDTVALAALAQYSVTNKTKRWQDSADSNIWWEANGGTNITAWRICAVTNRMDIKGATSFTGYQDVLLETWGEGYDISLWFRASYQNSAFGLLSSNLVNIVGNPFLYNSSAALPPNQSTFYFSWYAPQTESSVMATYGLSAGEIDRLRNLNNVHFTAQNDGDLLSARATGTGGEVWYLTGGWAHSNVVSTVTNAVGYYNLSTGDVWKAVSARYPSSNPSNYVSVASASGMVTAATANLLAVNGDGSRLRGLTGTNFTAGSITSAALALGAVTAANLAAGSVGASALATGSVTATKLAAGSVGTSELAANSVTVTALAAGSVGTNKAAIAEWNAWGNGRYLSLTSSSDLVLNPGRIVAGYGLNLTNISVNAYGASQQGYNYYGSQFIGTNAYGAEQRGFLASSSSATNNGKGSMQLFNLGASQKALMTGNASIGLGACTVTNDQAIVAGDGLVSRGNGTIAAFGFYGNGAGLTNLNLAAYVGNNLTWDAVSNKLVAAAGYNDSNAVSAVISRWPGLAGGESHWTGTASGLDAALGRASLGLGSAATNSAGAFAPADLSQYASGTVTYSNGHFYAATQLAPADVTNAVLAAWQNLDTDKTDDLTKAGGTLTGDLDMGGTHRLTGLASPQADSDAVSKGYLRLVLSNLKPQGDLSMGAYTNGAPEAFPLE